MEFYRSQILICTGTGCSSSNSPAIIERFEECIKEAGLEKEVKVVRTGCFGLCENGPICIVYPEGAFYSHIKVDDVPRIVSEHLVKGRIVADLLYKKSVNADGKILALDEIDKLASDMRGDPASALLEVFDSEQNYAFRDHFLEIPVDLSRVMFITTADSTRLRTPTAEIIP